MNIYDRNDQNLAAPRCQYEDTHDLPPAVGRFAATVDALVDAQLTSDEVEARLERVRRNAASDEWDLDSPNWHGFPGEELAEYGYRIVQMWLRIVVVWIRSNSAIGGQRVDLSDGDIDDLTKETVARGIRSLRDEAQRSGRRPWEDMIELRTTFLVQCARQLPHAYLSTVDPLEEELAGHSAGILLVRRLRHCATDWRDRTAHLLQSWEYSGQESDEIIRMTLEVLDRAAHRYPELAGPQTTDRAHSDQAVER